MPDISQFVTARTALASQDAKNFAPYLPLQSEDLAFETVHDTPEYTDVKIHFTTQDGRTFSREVRAWKPVTVAMQITYKVLGQSILPTFLNRCLLPILALQYPLTIAIMVIPLMAIRTSQSAIS